MKMLCMVLTLLCCLAGTQALAQIPNDDFEMWTSGNPDEWLTSNSPPTIINITQVSGAHSGTSAAQGEVINLSGFGYSPILLAGDMGNGFPVSARHEALHGWFKYTPVSGDQFFVIVAMVKQGSGVGGGTFLSTATQSSYAEFVADIFYGSPDIPDTCLIEVAVLASGGFPHVGSSFTVDDLSFGPTSGVKETDANIPDAFQLLQNYPNPFNPTTAISYLLPSASFVSLKVYDLLGREVATLVNEEKSAGTYSVTWNATGQTSGVYYYRLQAGNFVDTKRLILVR